MRGLHHDPKVLPGSVEAPLSMYDFLRLAEGFCPHPDHGRLTTVEELPDAGWCDSCYLGWSYRGLPALHLRPLP